MAKDKESYSNAGMNAYLSKPIIPKELDKILLEFLSQKEIKQGEETIKYDTVSYELLANNLGLKNSTILEKLIAQFQDTAGNFIEIIQDNSDIKNLKDHIHQIKGVVGNLRFNITYELCKKIEKELDNTSEFNDIIKNDIQKLSMHLKDLKRQSQLLLNNK
jgi:HPt (histidine-containing phosphotransfer) domain-containing protein